MTVAAMALIRMGELRVARQALERTVRLQPDQFEATVTLAELHVDLGNGWRGAQLFEAAARLRPHESRVWLALAKVLRNSPSTPKIPSSLENRASRCRGRIERTCGPLLRAGACHRSELSARTSEPRRAESISAASRRANFRTGCNPGRPRD